MQANYQPFVERMILHYEGGYGWDAQDPGGPTKFGITCYDLAQFYHEKMTSMSAWAPRVKAMTLTVADTIYRNKYATACQFDALNSGCDCVVFDFGVNSGPTRAIRFAQGVVGVAVDGILGPITTRAINAYDPALFINRLCNNRMNFLRGLKGWPAFGRGWTARVADLREYSLALAAKAVQPEPDVPESKEFRIPRAFAKAHDGSGETA